MIRKFANLRVLVIDDMGAMRSAIKVQLAEMEIVNVDQVGNAEDALRMIESRVEYDVIFCDYNLNRATSGQQLLEYVKSMDVLPARTVYIMVTAEAEYGAVVSAAEFQPDDYLLKPFTAVKIRSRLERLIDKRDALQDLLLCMAKKDFERAVAESDKLIKANSKWLMDALRRKGEALLRLGRHEEAIDVFGAALAMRSDLGWAQLGKARAYFAQGKPGEAEKIANDALESNGAFILAYDLLAEIAEDAGNAALAIDQLEQASTVVPSVRRFRILAEAAYRLSRYDIARSAFELAIRRTKGSITAQESDYLLLAQTHVEAGNPKLAFQVLEAGEEMFGDTGVFGRGQASVRAQAFLKEGNVAAAKKMLVRAGNLLVHPGANLETILMGKALLASGEKEEGLKFMEEALRKKSGIRMIERVAKTALAERIGAA